MRHIVLFYFLICASSTYGQGETNVWYFGNQAGLDFNSGAPVALTNGQLDTDEGCATLSNSEGELLFYTDGVTVYNRNHGVMQNGSGLMGHTSTSQSATIVAKPGSSTLFYIFTIDVVAHPNGFRYSIVDITQDGGLGAVTAEKNILIYAPTCEKIAVVKHSNEIDYWIITHGWDNNTFYAHLLTSVGLNPPILSNAGFTPTFSTSGNSAASQGYMKIAPNGSKLAICHQGSNANLQVLDFDNITGVVSNPITVLEQPGELYGIEFSPNSELLYASHLSLQSIYQYDLTASAITSTQVVLYSMGFYPGALQLGPDGKIYIAVVGRPQLGVIEDPNVSGIGCGLQIEAVDLGGKTSTIGLPAFNQSFFFVPSIQITEACEGESTSFSFNNSQPVLSVTWDFGDGSSSTILTPSHTYTSAGNYLVSVTVTTSLGTGTNNRLVTIHPKPTISESSVILMQCDDDNDGISYFNLAEAVPLLLSSSSNLDIAFYNTLTDAQSNTAPITNHSNYQNQTVSNDSVFLKVSNQYGCSEIAQINLQVVTTSIPMSFHRSFTVCDDDLSGSNNDGIATFDFSAAASDIEALYPTGQELDISYYKNIADALAEQNAIIDVSNFSNTDSPYQQNIFVRVDSQLDNSCLGLGHHITLNVEATPEIMPLTFVECDNDHDGIAGFDTSSIECELLNGMTNVTLTYLDENNQQLPSPLPNPFNSSTQDIAVRATNNVLSTCYFETHISFLVHDKPHINSIPLEYTTVCDDESDPALQDGLYPFDTSNFESLLLGGQTGMIISYYDTQGNILPSPLSNPFVSGTQEIMVEVTNAQNTQCAATLNIPLIVNPRPNVKLHDEELVCSDDPSFTIMIDAGLVDPSMINDFTYSWFYNGDLIPSANNYDLIINEEGVYQVEVSTGDGCTSIREITVAASEAAIIESIDIVDFTTDNTVTIQVSGEGNYVYSLDNNNYQTGNIFYNVTSGIYSVHVKDTKGCGIAVEDINVLGAPAFFTPNGDGFNDTWNIKGLNYSQNLQGIINIFDRYGKLLKQQSLSGPGWDGTFNGVPLPATDYWYTIMLHDGRTIRGNFALMR